MSLKASLLLVLHLGALSAASSTKTRCTKNACLATVSSYRYAPTSSASNACVNFLRSTVTPPIVTVTVTSGAPGLTHTPCPTTPAAPSTLPSYASVCGNTNAYSSACTCIGAPQGTTTIHPCTTHLISTSTSTSTTSGPTSSACGTTACSPPSEFSLEAYFDGTFLGQVTYDSSSNTIYIASGSGDPQVSFGTLSGGLLQDVTNNQQIYVEGTPDELDTLYDGSTDPSGNGGLVCSFGCDNTMCCTNAATGGSVWATDCNGGSVGSALKFGTVDEVLGGECIGLTMMWTGSEAN